MFREKTETLHAVEWVTLGWRFKQTSVNLARRQARRASRQDFSHHFTYGNALNLKQQRCGHLVINLPHSFFLLTGSPSLRKPKRTSESTVYGDFGKDDTQFNRKT